MRIVKNGDVHVSAPIGMPREKVMAFIEEHREWIDQARQSSSINCHWSLALRPTKH